MLHLLSSGVKDALPTINLHTHIELKVNVSLSSCATEAPVCWCAGPALAEQLTHSGKPRGLPVRRRSAVNKTFSVLLTFMHLLT